MAICFNCRYDNPNTYCRKIVLQHNILYDLLVDTVKELAVVIAYEFFSLDYLSVKHNRL